jgi:hypothetical protein
MGCQTSDPGWPAAGRAARPTFARTTLRAGAVALAVLLATATGFSGCAPRFAARRLEEESCTKKRLAAAAISYGEAKDQFAEHFKVRSDTALRYAYLASVDSVRLARSIRTCFDFTPGFKREAVELIRANRTLRVLIRINLRDPDPQVAIGIFGGQYREIFENDIN